MLERRIQRSHQSTEALTLLLDAARSKLGVRAITVATVKGQLIAGSGEDLQRVATMGSCSDRGQRGSKRSVLAVATWRLRVGNEDLVITSLGRTMSAELGEGVRRILRPR
jgi:hypothetical protein